MFHDNCYMYRPTISSHTQIIFLIFDKIISQFIWSLQTSCTTRLYYGTSRRCFDLMHKEHLLVFSRLMQRLRVHKVTLPHQLFRHHHHLPSLMSFAAPRILRGILEMCRLCKSFQYIYY